MSNVTTTVWGAAPWSGELLNLDGDVGRNRRLPSERDALLDKEQADFNELVDLTGVTHHDNGHFLWPDHLLAISTVAEGSVGKIEEGAVTRWFDTNTFYRKPVITEEARLTGDIAGTFINGEVTKDYEVTLLSPLAFSQLSDGAEGLDHADRLWKVGGLYKTLLEELDAKGVERVLFYEPYASYQDTNVFEVALLGELLNELLEPLPNVQAGIYLGYGDATKAASILAGYKRIGSIGWDVHKTPFSTNLPKLTEQRFIAGLVDTSNTLEEEDSDLYATLQQVIDHIEPKDITLTHTVELSLLPPDCARGKVIQLGRLARDYQGGAN